MPLLFSPVDPHVLYLGSNVLFKTVNGGRGWDVISPDLTREKYDIPPSVGVYTEEARKQATRRGVIYTIAPSHKDVNVIWAGTDDGLIHVTRDGGKTWNNITPKELTPWSKVSMLDASHFDDVTVYAAINRIRLDDLKPHIYRTHDGGKSWKEIVTGLPDQPVNTVREDPVRKGLLYAGTELAVYVSFDDGGSLAAAPAEHASDFDSRPGDPRERSGGRDAWTRLLDSWTISAPLRQINAESTAADAHLFRPSTALRVRWNNGTDTPLPPEEPAGQNPPDGAILYYNLKSTAATPVTLEIFDSAKKLVRRYSSDDKPDPIDPMLNVPLYWIRPPSILSGTTAGLHRFVWDLCYPPPDAVDHEYPISAILSRYAALSAGSAGGARRIFREADGQWKKLHASADSEDGPARENSVGGVAAAVRAGAENRRVDAQNSCDRERRAGRAESRADGAARNGGGSRCGSDGCDGERGG